MYHTEYSTKKIIILEYCLYRHITIPLQKIKNFVYLCKLLNSRYTNS